MVKKLFRVREKTNSSNPLISLDNFLKSRAFEEHLDTDFLTQVDFPTKKNAESNELEFEINEIAISFGKLYDDGSGGIINDDRFQIIATHDPKLNLKNLHNKGIIFNDNNSILILPIFYSIIFFKKLNMFVCSRVVENNGNIGSSKYSLYHFDIKGRFIKMLADRHYSPKYPKFAFLNDNSQKIVEVNFPEGYHLAEIVSYNLFVITKNGEFGLIDSDEKQLLDCVYEEILINKSSSFAFIQKDQSLFKFDLKSFTTEQLGFESIFDIENRLMKVRKNGKFGIINDIGEIVLDPNFDFINFSNIENNFRVFSGEYDWVTSESDYDIFDKYVSSGSYYQEQFQGILTGGKWGVVNSNNNLVLDYEYDWIEDFSEEYYLLNKGGKLFGYFDMDDKDDVVAIVDGKWNISDRNGKILNDEYTSNIEELLINSVIKEPHVFHNNMGIKAIVINTLQQNVKKH